MKLVKAPKPIIFDAEISDIPNDELYHEAEMMPLVRSGAYGKERKDFCCRS
jgi:hypothetical protein